MQNRFLLTPYFLDAPQRGLGDLAYLEWQVNTVDLPDTGQQLRMAALYRPLADFTAVTIARGDRPVSIAGDCCSAIGVLAGLQRAGVSPWLLWLDAHGDFNTRETTPSDFLGGMPLAMIVGRGDLTIPQALGLRPFPENQVILTDGRDLDPGEALALAASGLLHLKDAKSLLEHLPIDSPLYVHIDADIVSPKDAPAMNYLAAGGPSAKELEDLFRGLARTGRVAAVSMSTWNPELDQEGRSRRVCLELLDTLIG